MKHIEAVDVHIEAVDVTNCSDCRYSYWKGENGSPRDDYGAAVCNLLGRRISDTIVPYREIDPNCPLSDKVTEVKKKIGRVPLSKLFGR